MKKICLFLIAILIAFTSCDNEVVKNPAQNKDITEYCGFEVRAKMVDGSAKNTHYYFCLQNADTTLYNVSVGKKVYYEYNLGDTIGGCEEETDIEDITMDNAPITDEGYKIVMIGGENYLVIKLKDNLILKDTVKTNEQKE